MNRWFDAFATRMSNALSQPLAFSMALLSIILWAATGPWFDYGSGWQMVVNTGTTIISFLMIFVLLADSRRENGAIHLKLDEILRALKDASNAMIGIEASTRIDIEAKAQALHDEVKT